MPLRLLSLPPEVLELIFIWTGECWSTLCLTNRMFHSFSKDSTLCARILSRTLPLNSISLSPCFDAKIALALFALYSPSRFFDSMLLEYAATYNHLLLASLVIPTVSSQTLLDQTLIQACMCSNYNICKLLLDAHADIHTDSDAPLCMAAKYGWSDVVELLLSYGAFVNAHDNYPISWASKNGHIDVVHCLLLHEADHSNALAMAAEFGNTAICKLLIDFGRQVDLAFKLTSDIHASDDYALRWACVRGHFDTVDYLLGTAGANLHAFNNFALRNCAKLKLYEIVELLLCYGADPFANECEAISFAVSAADELLLSILLCKKGQDV